MQHSFIPRATVESIFLSTATRELEKCHREEQSTTRMKKKVELEEKYGEDMRDGPLGVVFVQIQFRCCCGR